MKVNLIVPLRSLLYRTKTKQSSEVVDGAIVPILDVHKEEQPLYNKLDIGFPCKTH